MVQLHVVKSFRAMVDNPNKKQKHTCLCGKKVSRNNITSGSTVRDWIERNHISLCKVCLKCRDLAELGYGS